MNVKQGTWVEIHTIILTEGERAPQAPDDTKQVPLEMKVKGFLKEDTAIGEEAQIVTATGRTLTGTLIEENPAYTHQFGAPIAELTSIGRELREILHQA